MGCEVRWVLLRRVGAGRRVAQNVESRAYASNKVHPHRGGAGPQLWLKSMGYIQDN